MSTGKIEKWNIGVGATLWLCCAAIQPSHPLTFQWPLLMVLLGAMVLVPFGRFVFHRHFPLAPAWKLNFLQLPATLAIAASAPFPPGPAATWLAVPWLIVTSLMALHAVKIWFHPASKLSTKICLLGWLQLPIGTAWLVADRAAWQPLGFDGQIVRLTAAHFHFAGYLLPLSAGLIAARSHSRLVLGTALGASCGVLLVAAGITSTKLGAPIFVESALAALFCMMTLLLSVFMIQSAYKLRNAWLTMSGVSLLVGMCLAMTYALRPWLPVPWLHIPRMWAIHGTIQAFGFGFIGLIGWSTLECCGMTQLSIPGGMSPSIKKLTHV